MRITTTRVKNGRVDIDADALPEGKLVRVVLLGEEPVRLSDEEKDWLTNVMEESRRGEATDAFAFLQEIELSR